MNLFFPSAPPRPLISMLMFAGGGAHRSEKNTRFRKPDGSIESTLKSGGAGVNVTMLRAGFKKGVFFPRPGMGPKVFLFFFFFPRVCFTDQCVSKPLCWELLA